jgi:hypothetical protein
MSKIEINCTSETEEKERRKADMRLPAAEDISRMKKSTRQNQLKFKNGYLATL